MQTSVLVRNGIDGRCPVQQTQTNHAVRQMESLIGTVQLSVNTCVYQNVETGREGMIACIHIYNGNVCHIYPWPRSFDLIVGFLLLNLFSKNWIVNRRTHVMEHREQLGIDSIVYIAIHTFVFDCLPFIGSHNYVGYCAIIAIIHTEILHFGDDADRSHALVCYYEMRCECASFIGRK